MTFCRFERILLFNYEIWNRFFFLCRVVSVIIVWTWRQVSTWSVSFVNPLNFYKNPIINPISSTVIHRRRLLSFALSPTTTTTTKNMLFCLSIRFLSKFFGSPQSSYFLKENKKFLKNGRGSKTIFSCPLIDLNFFKGTLWWNQVPPVGPVVGTSRVTIKPPISCTGGSGHGHVVRSTNHKTLVALIDFAYANIRN